MNPQYQPNPAYPGFQPGTQPPPGMTMMDPNMAQMTQQRIMQQHRERLAAMHASGMIPPGAGFPGMPAGPSGPGGMRMPPGMGMQQPGMHGLHGPGGPSHQPQMQQHGMHATQPPPKQKKKPGPQPRQTPASQMMPQQRQPPTTAEQYMKNAMAPPAHHNEVEPWADALDELDPRELAMGRFRTRNEMMEEVFGPEPIKNIPLGDGDAWAGLGIDGETLEAKVTALEKENAELEQGMEANLEGWKKRLQDIEAGEAAATPVPAS